MSPDQSTAPRVIVGMAAYNEERYVGSMVLLARQYADEVIVVDDGSKDRTSAVAKLAGATVIRHDKNQGKGVALQSIMSAARKRIPDVLVILDADYQHRPEEIPSLIKPIAEGFDLVIGSRKMQEANIPRYRRAGQKVLAYFSRVLSRKTISDTESGFRALSKKAIAEIHLREHGFAVETEMISLAVEKGLKVTEVPISVVYTRDGSTLNPVRHGFSVLNRIMAMISERRPLLFFGLCGGICILLGLIFGITVVKVLFTSQILQTGSALLSMMLITIGILCVFVGIILNVLTRRMGGSS